ETLSKAGYRRYEVSNHAKPGEESRHNLGYWRDAQWLGLGAGAHSSVGGRRWKNVDDPAEYVARVRAAGEAEAWWERPTPRQRGLNVLRWPGLFAILALSAAVKVLVDRLIRGSWRQDAEGWVVWLAAGLFASVLLRFLGVALERRHALRKAAEAVSPVPRPS